MLDINRLENILEDDGIVFLSYGGFLSQALISGMTEALEKESKINDINMTTSSNILTIFIELSQNMMNYSKVKTSSDDSFDSKGLIVVGYCKDDDSYYVLSRNIISHDDKRTIEPKIEQVIPLNKAELKILYRDLRKSGKGMHDKGAGIGFVEVARRCDSIEYNFSPIDDEKYYYAFKAIIKNKQKD